MIDIFRIDFWEDEKFETFSILCKKEHQQEFMSAFSSRTFESMDEVYEVYENIKEKLELRIPDINVMILTKQVEKKDYKMYS